MWKKYWAAGLSLMTCSMFGHYYLHKMKKQMGADFDRAVLVTKRGYSYCYFDEEYRKKYGEFIGKKVLEQGIDNYIAELKKQFHVFINLIDEIEKKEVTKKDFDRFMKEFNKFCGLYISQRNIIDFLPEKQAKTVFEKIKESRKYTEESWVRSEDFEHHLSEKISKKAKISKELILCMTFVEVQEYLGSGKMVQKKTLEKRDEMCTQIFFQEKEELLVGKKASDAEIKIIADSLTGEIKGQSAYPGKVKGRARIILSPENVVMGKNDIIVTGMTRPEHLPLMEKALGFVTDAGGILCHAAIVSREMKKPCIIGTQNATLLIKEGDLIELDASRGIVTKCKKNS